MSQDLSAHYAQRLRWHVQTRKLAFGGDGSTEVMERAADALEAQAAEIARLTAERDGLRVAAERLSRLPCLPTPRVLASGSIAGKRVELHGWHTDDIEIWERQHGIKFGAAREST